MFPEESYDIITVYASELESLWSYNSNAILELKRTDFLNHGILFFDFRIKEKNNPILIKTDFWDKVCECADDMESYSARLLLAYRVSSLYTSVDNVHVYNLRVHFEEANNFVFFNLKYGKPFWEEINGKK